tara:strand:+ start:5299 stop:5598 length:300 start_codon:yes stop_codon:yes gene_type:complete
MTRNDYDIELDIDPEYDAGRMAVNTVVQSKEDPPVVSKEEMLDTICNENTYVTPENMKIYIDHCNKEDIANEMEFTIYGLQAELNRLANLLFKYTQHED